MTIEAWNIVLSAAILVLMTGGGLWLKYVVDQQLKAKDTAIQALEGVVKFKDAHIASLQGDTAPAIAKAYTAMREHANQTSKDNLDLRTMVDDAVAQNQMLSQLIPAQVELQQANGLNMASDILHKHVGKLLFPDGKTVNRQLNGDDPFIQVMVDAFLKAGTEIASESIKRAKDAGREIEPFRKLLEDGEN
jgi:hypothetical protein